MNTVIVEPDTDDKGFSDIYQKLASDRILFISDEITDDVATEIVASLITKNKEDDSKPITLFLNSDGGDIRNVFMIYDMMRLVTCPIETICLGEVAAEAVLLLAAGTPGMRKALPNTIVTPSQLDQNHMIYGSMQDMRSAVDRLSRDNQRFMAALAAHLGKKPAKLIKELVEPLFLSATEALEFGIIDKVTTIKD
jgi:ATP-dependent Clp protease protease subunit